MQWLEEVRQGWRRGHAFLTVLARGGRWQAGALCALTLFRSLVPTAIILATGVLIDGVPEAVDRGLDSAAGRHTLWALAAVAGAFLVQGLAEALATYAARSVGSRYAITVHDLVAGAALRSPGIATLEDPEVAGELATVEEYDRAGLYRSAITQLGEYVSQRLQGVAAFVILLGFQWWAPLVVLAGWRLVNRTVAQWVEKGIHLGHLQSGLGLRRAQYYRSLAVDAPAAKEVRIFGLAEWVVDQYTDRWRAAMAQIWQGRKTSLRGIVLTALGLAVAHGVVLGALGQAALAGTISLGELVIFGQAVLASVRLGPLGDFQWQSTRILHGAQQALELETRLAHDAPLAVVDTTPQRPGRAMAVTLRGVGFTYRGRSEPTLKNLDLTIPAGQSLAIVGENGVGKTTLIKLLCGLYQPEAGKIQVGGTDPIQARRHLGVIFQEFVRFELPLRANIGFGNLARVDATEELEEALRQAGGEELLSQLPAGWDTVLARGYDQGTDLSGGQWQKVALARALTAIRGGAGLLILDEPTANLDVRAETELFERWLEITREVTTILVSHRLSSVRHADRIVVLADGHLVEDGTHTELLRLDGRYARMYGLQATRFAMPKAPLDVGVDLAAATASGSAVRPVAEKVLHGA